MKVILESINNINIFKLPINITGNFWITYNSKNLINIEEQNGKWVLISNNEVKISKSNNNEKLSNVNYIDSVILEENTFYYLTDLITNDIYKIYILPSYEIFDNFVIDYKQNNLITIGNKNTDIIIQNELLTNKSITIEYDKNNNGILLKNLNKNINVFINNIKCNEKYLANGDIIFTSGLFIYYFGTILLVSNNKNDLVFDSLKLNKRLIKENPNVDYTNNIDQHITFFDKSKYYQRPPRFKRQILTKTFNIDAPPNKEKQEEMPLIFTIAPMLTMGMMSMVTGVTSLQKVLEGKSTLKDEFASLLMCGCMLLSMILFPLLQKFYTKIKKKEKERKRRRKYKKYIESKREEIFAEINYQKQVLIEDNLPIDKVRDIILNRQRNLWERKIEHPDFLEFRLGIGNKKPDIDIKYPENHFTLDEDNLRDIIDDLVNESKDIENVPITLNVRENDKVGIIGDSNIFYSFMDTLMLQLMAFHGYDMLRLIILTNDNNKTYWEKYINLPYLWNDEKSIRYFATNKEDINKLTSYLMEEYNYRKEVSEENKDKISFNPYYLVITDDVINLNNNLFVKEILKSKTNLGYSILLYTNKLDNLPNECSMFINIAMGMSGIFTNQMNDTNQIAFNPDLINFSVKSCITNISNIPMDINNGKFVLPKKYSFLEMFDVGNLNQLNILNRWKNNDIINSLSTPVGIDEQGELFNIDLHEKAHGPHGLVAGMTGSGKSEWIITYILSMAVNYSPEEVQFVLIDYKGGGLALTFDNRETGIKLPHVVGTITNLDLIEIKRSLASIESELKRRQSMFKKAREELNESSMDIYKYQEYYRAGKLTDPMSHLFIISDEFAELKTQQPEFMEKLISTARIGRSLGVHLILATQKPSGVVDDQIWSNSKFRVCLKVQDKSDSNDMIKCPDAAMIKETGRFFLQVGYNEFFAKGQSAYAGMPYYESDKKITLVDSSIDFVDNIGTIIKKGDVEKNNTQYVHKGEELPNILNYIIDTSKKENLKITQLWLSRIPEVIYVDKLAQKYNYNKENYILNPIIGEYDYPSKQTQELLTLPISKDGNVLIYGASGSGKELLLTTILYSLMNNHTPYEVGFYILDFGSEVLNNFEAAPHTGDIIHSGDEEKIENLFKYIKSEISSRRKKFLSHNGNYYEYIKNTGEKIPNLLVIINQFDVFSDLYNNYIESIADLTRDCVKYGIYFILTSSSSNGIKTKVSQNFKTILTLQLNDEYDYRNLLGNTNGIVPSKIYGRGLIKKDVVLEFQTAYAFEKDELYFKIKELCIKNFMKYKIKNMAIPVLPNVVTYKDIETKDINLNNIPVGIIKNNLSIASIKLKELVSYIISSRSFDDVIPFVDKLLFILNNNYNSINTIAFDAKYLYEENKFDKLQYINSNYSEQLKRISDYADQINDVLIKNNNNIKSIKEVKELLCVIIGFDKFVSSLSEDDKKLFENTLNKSKDSLKIHFIFIDIPGGFKKYEFEAWFKASINQSCGLWIGDGFAEQYAIKPTKMLQSYYDLIGIKFGYIVDNGTVEFIKLIEKE